MENNLFLTSTTYDKLRDIQGVDELFPLFHPVINVLLIDHSRVAVACIQQFLGGKLAPLYSSSSVVDWALIHFPAGNLR